MILNETSFLLNVTFACLAVEYCGILVLWSGSFPLIWEIAVAKGAPCFVCRRTPGVVKMQCCTEHRAVMAAVGSSAALQCAAGVARRPCSTAQPWIHNDVLMAFPEKSAISDHSAVLGGSS